jgi:hypothetical protein
MARKPESTSPDQGRAAAQPTADAESTTTDLVRDAQRVAVDLLVFAPIGLAKRARTLLPDLIRDGRATAASAKTIGKFVTPIARKQGTKLVKSKVESLTQPKTRRSATITPPASPSAPASPRVTASSADPVEPFEGYDHLGSAAVVARLGELSAKERAGVLRYEQAHRNRRTILGRIDQLDADPK